MAEGRIAQARGTSDGADRLVEADAMLAELQRSCGGDMPGTIAVPALLELVTKARRFDMRLARTFAAQDGANALTAWAEIAPRSDGQAGCDIVLRDWRSTPLPPESGNRQQAIIDRELADLTARLDTRQCVLAVNASAPDLLDLAKAMQAGRGRPWTEFIGIVGNGHQQPMHWRLLDGAEVTVPGSDRPWRVALIPHEAAGGEPQGFDLVLAALAPLPSPPPQAAIEAARAAQQAAQIGRDIAPVLRQPIARIIANAETIRTRMAGPLDEAYAQYAADIAAAGQHLLGLLEDLSDLEVVEADDFSTAPDRIDLADVARQATGILGVRAREHGIVVDAPRLGESLPAIAEFRRVLQILLNLIGNAIRYSPTGSQVWIRLEGEGDKARVIVADQGPGIASEDQPRVFDKFERLGRSGDGGSGLGLYISRRLARAMQGDLTLESAPGQGARFVLELPVVHSP
jgi:signal transduction histidine kinase